MQRAEEIIAETYKQVREAREKGRNPDRVVMNRELWLRIVEYRRSLGVIAGPVPDYLSEDGLFGLEIWYGDGPGIRVE
jgi:hypothetical protein